MFDLLTIMFQSVDYVAEIDVLTRLLEEDRCPDLLCSYLSKIN